MKEIVHICFSESAKGSFRHSIARGILPGKKVISLDDNLSLGPINRLDDLESREKWFKDVLHSEMIGIEEYLQYSHEQLYREIEGIGEEDIYIWHGCNEMELCGLMYMLSLLENKLPNISLINVSDRSFTNEYGGVYTAKFVGELHPKQLAMAMSSKRPLDSCQYDILMKQWQTLIKEDNILRIYKDNKVISVPLDYYDEIIMRNINNDFRKCVTTIAEVFGKIESLSSDEYIFWRIMELIRCNKVEYRGTFGLMWEMDIKKNNQ